MVERQFIPPDPGPLEHASLAALAASGEHREALNRDIAMVCARLLGCRPVAVHSPGGRSRATFRVIFAGGKSAILAHRKQRSRAFLEAKVLHGLHAVGAPAPRLYGFDGEWTAFEDLGPRRLSQVLEPENPEAGHAWLDSALQGLHLIHTAGDALGFNQRIAVIGRNQAWLDHVLETPDRISAMLGIDAPDFDRQGVGRLINSLPGHFIKWDARPGNAAARRDGSVAWFDWEHCGVRSPIDDLAWLLGDEFVPDWPDVEKRLMEKYLPLTVPAQLFGYAVPYLASFGSLHICKRLELILKRRGNKPWWSWTRCLENDYVGVTREAAERLCLRGGRWSAKGDLSDPLSSWFDELKANLPRDN